MACRGAWVCGWCPLWIRHGDWLCCVLHCEWQSYVTCLRWRSDLSWTGRALQHCSTKCPTASPTPPSHPAPSPSAAGVCSLPAPHPSTVPTNHRCVCVCARKKRHFHLSCLLSHIVVYLTLNHPLSISLTLLNSNWLHQCVYPHRWLTWFLWKPTLAPCLALNLCRTRKTQLSVRVGVWAPPGLRCLVRTQTPLLTPRDLHSAMLAGRNGTVTGIEIGIGTELLGWERRTSHPRLRFIIRNEG